MDNLIFEHYKSGKLHHAILLDTDKVSALDLYRSFIAALTLNPADYILVDSEESIKVAEAREIRRFVQKSRFTSPLKAVFITDAKLLTPEAANALLKTLEEPPPSTYLFLATERIEELLPTVRSRCKVIRHYASEPSAGRIGQKLPLHSRLADYFSLSKDLATSNTPLPELIEQWLRGEAEEMLDSSRAKRIKVLLTYLPLAKTNANRRLLLDNLFLDIYNYSR